MRSYRLFILTCFLAVKCHISFSQTGPVLPEFLPASPDVSAIIKGGDLSVNPHTGMANAAIPVYEIKLKDFTLPISLNYSSNGFKPEEIPSRVGIGFHLNAGGLVSRIVQGKPDDENTTMSTLTTTEIMSYSNNAMSHLNALTDNAYNEDAQPDEYRYNINGLSGKFFISRMGTIIQLPYNNLKIQVSRTGYNVHSISIVDEKGVRYIFGDIDNITERTIEHNLQGYFLNKSGLKTAWFLTKIILPNGEYLNFSYSSINTYTHTGFAETVEKSLPNGLVCECEDEGTYRCQDITSHTEKHSTVQYRSYVLASINTSTGVSVIFYYDPRPDNSEDVRLNSINIFDSFLSRPLKDFQFAYSDPSGEDMNNRFFLKYVYMQDPESTEQQKFEVIYNNENETPPGRFTNAKDHFGFYNGATNSTALPGNTSQAELFATYATANREPNGLFAQKWMLKKLIYPTGGYDEFFYEPNMESRWDSIPVSRTAGVQVSGHGSPSTVTYEDFVYITQTQLVDLYVSTSWDGVGSTPCCPNSKNAICTVIDYATGNAVTVVTMNGYRTENRQIQLLAGHTYILELVVRTHSANYAVANFGYIVPKGKVWGVAGKQLPGVRVRKVASFDPVSNKSTNRFYRYWSLTDTITASANILYNYFYLSDATKEVYCPCTLNVTFECHSKVISSNSVVPLYINDAAPVTYKWIIESDDSTLVNGGTEHTYLSEGALAGATVIGKNIPDSPLDPYNYRNGTELQTRIFNKNRQVIKKINNYYSTDSRVNIMQLENLIVRKRYEPAVVQYPLTETSFRHFDVEQYPIYTSWYHLDSTVTREYDFANNVIQTSKVSYAYNRTDNINPSSIATIASDGKIQRIDRKYVNDFAGQAVYNAMISKNMIADIIEETSFHDNKLTGRTFTEYQDWFGNQSIIAPSIIKTQKRNTDPLENRIHFVKYDTKGHVLELKKDNSVTISYIWDYQKNLPVAQITNASSENTAYTSFETDVSGGWTYSGIPATDATAPTGNKVYNLASPISIAGLNSATSYIITYWAKDGSVSVQGIAGTAVISKNGWTLFRHAASSYTQLTISGSGLIDELRLYPTGATMKTFTYLPSVGVSSTADENNYLLKYEYDGFNRLSRIRNWDRNIIKQYSYIYGSAIAPCANTLASWQPTGVIRCAKNNPVNNNNTGYEEREEKDVNNCSPTYLTTRWVQLSISSNCPVVPNCTGAGKRVVNGICETGSKVVTSTVRLGNGPSWMCTYHYEWSDGFIGPELTEFSYTPCASLEI